MSNEAGVETGQGIIPESVAEHPEPVSPVDWVEMLLFEHSHVSTPGHYFWIRPVFITELHHHPGQHQRTIGSPHLTTELSAQMIQDSPHHLMMSLESDCSSSKMILLSQFHADKVCDVWKRFDGDDVSVKPGPTILIQELIPAMNVLFRVKCGEGKCGYLTRSLV